MIDVFLLLGSNLGERFTYLQAATQLIGEEIAPVVKASAVYETQSWGKTDEPDYLNQVIQLKTDMPARQVLEKALAIERKLGRERKERWGARTIDIDILLYGDEVIDEDDLKVPHPGLPLRRFALEPLNEIAPEVIHPVVKKNIGQLKSEVADLLIVKKVYF